MGLTYYEALQEPAEAIELALMIWDMDAKRANLKSGK
jgi:hypothetical protein